jgi:hypothetical protein
MSENHTRSSFNFAGELLDTHLGFSSQGFESFYGVEMCRSADATTSNSTTQPLYPELQECYLALPVENPQQNSTHADAHNEMRLFQTGQRGTIIAHTGYELDDANERVFHDEQHPSCRRAAPSATQSCQSAFKENHFYQASWPNPTTADLSNRNLTSRRVEPSKFADIRTTLWQGGELGDLRYAIPASGCPEGNGGFISPGALASSDGSSLDSSLYSFPQLHEACTGKSTVVTASCPDVCQASGCRASLEGEKIYCKRYRLCSHCIGRPMLWINGTRKRFCQQCSLLHEVGEFDGEKKSCRKKLQAHALRLRNKRRQQASRLGRMIKSGTNKKEMGKEEESQ